MILEDWGPKKKIDVNNVELIITDKPLVQQPKKLFGSKCGSTGKIVTALDILRADREVKDK